MAKKNTGYIKLNRDIMDSFLWHPMKPNKFDERSAYIDLCLLANFTDAEFQAGKRRIVVKSGQLITSLNHLAERWNWSKQSVLNYLNMLQEAGFLYKESTSRFTVLTLIKYRDSDNCPTTDKTTDKTATVTTDKTALKTTAETQYKNDKECIKKNIKNEKESKKEPTAQSHSFVGKVVYEE